MKVWILAVLLAAMLVPSGIYGSYYFAGAQQTPTTTIASTQQPSIQLNSTSVNAGQTILVNGKNFTQGTPVSVSFDRVLSSAQLVGGGSAIVAQGGIQAGQTQTPTGVAANTGSSGFDIFGFFSGLFGIGKGGNNNTSTNGSIAGGTPSSQTQQSIFLAIQTAGSGANNATLNCGGHTFAQVKIPSSGTAVAQTNMTSGIYSDCAINVGTQGGTQATALSPITVSANTGTSPTPITQTKVQSDGTFSTSLTVPAESSGNYTVLAVGTQEAAFAQVTVNSAAASPSAAVSGNATTSNNATMSQSNTSSSSASNNSTSTENQNLTGQFAFSQAASSSSSSSSNSTSAGTAQVSVGNATIEQGAPLAVTGQGFKPQAPIQIFINNVQVTNIVTNIQGSFNSVVIVPTTVNAGSAKVVVKAEQTTVNQDVTVVKPTPESLGPEIVTFAAVSTTGQSLAGAPVTVFDTATSQLVESGKTPLQLDLKKGTYSVFYSAFDGNRFVSAFPGEWARAGDVGAGIITVHGGGSMTVTATYRHFPVVTPPPQTTTNSLTLKAVDTSGNPLNGMFVTVYSADNGKKIQQGFTDTTVSNLKPGTYPIFFANFGAATFASASPGTWVQTPYGGAGMVTIPDDGTVHSITVTAVYQVSQTTTASFAIQAPINISGTIFSITSNQTNPQGPFINSGIFRLKVDNENPATASFSASIISVRSDINSNVIPNSQQSRAHTTFQIDNLKPSFAKPVGPDTYVIIGTADVLMDGSMYSSAEPVQITLTGGNSIAPTGIQIAFQGTDSNSAAAHFETLYGAVDIGLR